MSMLALLAGAVLWLGLLFLLGEWLVSPKASEREATSDDASPWFGHETVEQSEKLDERRAEAGLWPEADHTAVFNCTGATRD